MTSYVKNKVVLDDLNQIVDCSQITWESFRNMTIAITGATGLIGRTLVWALLLADKKHKLNMKVVAFVRDTKKAEMIFDGADSTVLKFVCQDITQPISDNIHADYMIHGAAITASKMMIEQPVETIMTTIDGTRNMMNFAARCKMKGVVYLSSMEAYGVVSENCNRVKENDLGFIDPLNVRSSYSEGKRMAECLCASYTSEYGVPIKIARLAATFGAGIDAKENRVFAQFSKSIISDEDIILHTKGEKANCYCYTVDAVMGLLILLLKGESGQAYNICNMETFCSIKEMAQIFINLSESKKSKLVFDIPKDLDSLGYAPTSIMRLDSEKMMRLGWKPKYDMEAMANRLIQSLKEGE